MENSYLIVLESCGNPDFGQDPDSAMSPLKMVPFYTIEEAQKIQSDYCRDYELGGGNWCGGNIWCDKKIVAYMSYNGRVWESSTGEYSPDNKEIKNLSEIK